MTKPIWELNPVPVVSFLLIVMSMMLLVSVSFLSIAVVEQGEVGVVTNPSGEEVERLEAGVHSVIPVWEHVEIVNKSESDGVKCVSNEVGNTHD